VKGQLTDLFKKKGPIRKIAVVGMGYVGIPAATLFADSPVYDFVWGIQRESASSGHKIAMLNAGKNPLIGEEPGLDDLLERVVREKKFACTADFSRITEADAVTIAIQTPFKRPEDLEPDLSALQEGLRQVGSNLSEGMLVVLESTVTPHTTGGMARKILEVESKLTAGEDFALAHAPERVMVGRLLQNIREHDRIIGGIDEASTQRAMDLYRPVLTKGRLIPMSATAAEVTKTAENTFRDLQIAAINQLALYCEAIGVNVYDVRNGIDSLKGEGITRAVLWPGAGVGGHCLTKDTYHLERGVIISSKPLDFPEDLQSLYLSARRINSFMPKHMFHLTVEGLRRAGKAIANTKIALLGWSFIKNSGDTRNTPSEVYRDLCIESQASVRVHDPFVESYTGVPILKSLEETVRGSDAIVIFTAHRDYHDLSPLHLRALSGKQHPVIVDGRNLVDPDTFIQQGFIYKGIGRGDKNNHPIQT
jgi:UDP-N-acetyl-D-mannosaminuronic acid dehydrogenase